MSIRTSNTALWFPPVLGVIVFAAASRVWGVFRLFGVDSSTAGFRPRFCTFGVAANMNVSAMN